MGLRRLPARIVNRRRIADDVIEVSVTRPASFAFSAGQYLQIGVAVLHGRDPRGNSRVFSISSSPNDTETLTFAFRRSGSGFKQTMEQIPLGAPVRLSGPYGHVTLTHHSRRPRILVARGVGITPHMSMLRFAAEESLSVPLTLLYEVAVRERAAYLDELKECAQANKSMAFRLSIGMLSTQELSRARAEHPDALWYLSGSPARVLQSLTALHSLGVRDEDLVTEEFVGY